MTATEIVGSDEAVHDADPGDWSWSESWFFSFIDLQGGPACTFRVGVTPNQDRAMLWCFLFVDGAWVTLEESRLAFSDVDFSDSGLSYDKWSLRFSWIPEVALSSGRFAVEGIGLVRSGRRAGARVPFSIALTYAASAPVHGTGLDVNDIDRTSYGTGRFEQSLVAEGTVVVDGRDHPVRAGAHRDKSWGPRDWRHNFVIGDLQSEGRQLYFVGRTFPEEAGGYVRNDSPAIQPLRCVEANIDFDDADRTIGTSRLVFETIDDSGQPIEVALKPIAPSIQFDIAHSVEEPEHWLYYRTLVEANVSTWGAPVRGWFEAGRHGVT